MLPGSGESESVKMQINLCEAGTRIGGNLSYFLMSSLFIKADF